MTRVQILDREFTRAPFPGLRRFSLGLIGLAKQLDVAFVHSTPPVNEDGTPVDSSRDMAVAAWLLDESHDLITIRRAAAMGRAAFLAEHLDAYEFAVAPAKMQLAAEEVRLTVEGVEAASFAIKAKPDDKPSSEPGNS